MWLQVALMWPYLLEVPAAIEGPIKGTPGGAVGNLWDQSEPNSLRPMGENEPLLAAMGATVNMCEKLLKDMITCLEDPSKTYLLGKPLKDIWHLETTYSWAYNPTYSLPKWPFVGYPIRSRVISPFSGCFEVP